MTDLVFLNGKFIEKSHAKISVLDRGFLFGDAIYEVIPVYQSTPFRLEQHLQRLDLCLTQVKIPNPYQQNKWQQIIKQLLSYHNIKNSSIYIQITRGISENRQHIDSKNIQPSVLIMLNAATTTNKKQRELDTISALLLEDIRWQYCHIKTTSLLANILLRQQAQSIGGQEAILHRGEQVTEGATSNIFIVKNNIIMTPIKDSYILGGITRDLIIELAKKNGLTVQETQVTVKQLYQADEVWLSSSTREISPVGQINDKMINKGLVGPVAKQLHCAFQEFKQALIK